MGVVSRWCTMYRGVACRLHNTTVVSSVCQTASNLRLVPVYSSRVLYTLRNTRRLSTSYRHQMAAVPEWLKKVTDDWSTDRFHPEYDEFNYNHLYQGIIALWQLGANEEQCRRFAERRSVKCEPAEVGKDRVETGKKLLSEASLEELRGKRVHFNELIAHFRQRLVDLGNDRDLLLNTELPALINGVATGAFHGTIQIGYGYIVNDERLLCEGLAYIHFAYCPFVFPDAAPVTTTGNGDTDVFALLRELKEDGELTRFADDKMLLFNDGRDRSKFAKRVLTLLTLKANELVKLANRIKLPDWFDKSNIDADQLRRLSGWIVDQTLVLFSQSERRNNFYLLHGVTSAWALHQFLPLLTDPQQALRTVTLFLASQLAAYLAIHCPAVNENNMADLDTGVTWRQILEKNLTIELDEHQNKVVHVCQCRIGENPGQEEMYRRAAQICTYYPFTYL